MKKFIAFILVIITVVLLASCKEKHIVYFESLEEIEKTVYVKDGSAVEEFTPSAKEGHIFLGWFYNGDEYDFNTPVTADMTIVAEWELEVYTITFNDETGKKIRERQYTYGEEIKAPAAPAKASDDDYDYTFAGWGKEFSYAKENLVLTATYTKSIRTYQVNFYNELGELLHTDKVEKGSKVQVFSYTKENTTKFNYSFKAWYTSEEEEYDFNTIVTKDINLYARLNAEPTEFSLQGKKISFIGDSVSTFYSSTSSVNSYYTAKDEYYYPTYSGDVKTVDKCWWKILIDDLKLTLGVNNSLSGSCLSVNGRPAKSDERINALGENGDPDIIVIYIGINDNVNGVSNSVFKKAYEEMLTKINKKYPNAYVFLGTMHYSNYHINMPNNHANYSETTRQEYNNIVRDLSEKYNTGLIEFASAVNETNWGKNLGDNLHFNVAGMKAMASQAVLDIKAYFGIE